jgi:8-oxo-dGTP pyrophosphatase MutT (NUDIX family)
MTNEKNPWKTLSSKRVYKNPWIDVREDQVINPMGNAGIYGVVQCRPAIGIVALTLELEIYLVGQYRYPLDRYSWEIIEGGGEAGESHLESAKRELKEEAGIQAERWELILNEFHLSNCHSDEKAYIFLAEDLVVTNNEPDETEELQVKKIKLTDALEQVDSGFITDAMSMLGIIKVARLKGLL